MGQGRYFVAQEEITHTCKNVVKIIVVSRKGLLVNYKDGHINCNTQRDSITEKLNVHTGNAVTSKAILFRPRHIENAAAQQVSLCSRLERPSASLA